MPTTFYNSLTRKIEIFTPIQDGKVSLYTCGPTVYDVAHIGNFRAFMFEDLLKRYLLLKDYNVTHVMNITDVDDKTIKRSIENNTPIQTLTETYTNKFFDDLKTLKILPADLYPRATEHIDLMIKMTQDLIDKKHAYITEDGSVYFSIDSFPDYGNLVHLDFTGQQSADRITSDEYTKDNPQDFVLWKAWKEEDGDVAWDSPWGKGRPGWHIECSAMSTKYLGNHFDIHCGGVDNMFPHHENEIAQSQCATGEKFVNMWMHCEYLLVDGGKMSKSLNNFYRISDLLDQGFTSETLRYILLNTHYRTALNFSLKKKHEAFQAIKRIIDISDRLNEFADDSSQGIEHPDVYQDFIRALDDDLDTPKAFAVFFQWVKRMNQKLDDGTLDTSEASSGLAFIEKFNAVFDLLPSKTEIPPNIQKLLNERKTARETKNWSLSDQLRDEILSLGWIVKDTPDGQKCDPVN